MGVYNPRAKMPNWCGDCDSLLEGTEECEIYTIKDLQMHKRNDDCPLIEIDLVRCGECKHRDSEFCQIRESMYGIKDNDFCSYGERRADE